MHSICRIIMVCLILFIHEAIISQDGISSFQNEIHIVNEYISELLQLEIMQQGTLGPRYFHPDYMSLPIFNEQVFIVCDYYTIQNVEKRKMNINKVFPKEEYVLLVEVSFPTIGFISDKKFYKQTSDLVKTYYLSNSTGDWLILKEVREGPYIATLPMTLNWLEYKNKYFGDYLGAYESLLENFKTENNEE